jgi:hypothetical protein
MLCVRENDDLFFNVIKVKNDQTFHFNPVIMSWICLDYGKSFFFVCVSKKKN